MKTIFKITAAIMLFFASSVFGQTKSSLSDAAVIVPYSDEGSVLDKKAPGWCKGDVTIHCGPFGDIGATWDICGFWNKAGQSNSLVYGSETKYDDVSLSDNNLIFKGAAKDSFLQYNTDIIYETSKRANVLIKKGLYKENEGVIKIPVKISRTRVIKDNPINEL